MGTVGGNVKWCRRCGKQYGGSSKDDTETPYDLAVPLLSTYSKELKAETGRDVYTAMSTAALSTVAER